MDQTAYEKKLRAGIRTRLDDAKQRDQKTVAEGLIRSEAVILVGKALFQDSWGWPVTPAEQVAINLRWVDALNREHERQEQRKHAERWLTVHVSSTKTRNGDVYVPKAELERALANDLDHASIKGSGDKAPETTDAPEPEPSQTPTVPSPHNAPIMEAVGRRYPDGQPGKSYKDVAREIAADLNREKVSLKQVARALKRLRTP